MIPAAPISFWQNFDFISMGVITVLVGALVGFHKRTIGILFNTISETIAHTPRSSLIFSIGMTIFFPLYYVFMYFWVGPRLVVPLIFYHILLVSAICELIFVWVPAVPGRKNIIHSIAAGLVGFFMLVLQIIVLATADNLNNWSRYSIITFLAVSALMVISLAIGKVRRRYTFTYEVIYCLLFFVSMSIIAHS